MNPNPDKKNEDPHISDDQLDQLLSMAKPPQPDRRQKQRMRRNLDELLTGKNRSITSLPIGWGIGISAVTTACLLVIALWVFRSPNKTNDPIAVAQPKANTAPLPTHTVEVFTQTVWVKAQQKAPVSDWIARKVAQARVQIQLAFDSELSLRCLEELSVALDNELRNPTVNDAKSRGSLRWLQRSRLQLQRRLQQKITAPATPPEQRLLAFRKLCRCSSSQSLDFLLAHWSIVNLRAEIANAACRLADSQTVSILATSTDDSKQRLDLMTCLLERGDSASVDAFLELVSHHQIFDLARQCGATTRRFPADQLLTALQSNRLQIVRAAAATLSAAKSDSITDRLCSLTSDPQMAQAAWLALTARQDSRSVRFVRRAAADLRWSATVVTAKRKWNRILAVN